MRCLEGPSIFRKVIVVNNTAPDLNTLRNSQTKLNLWNEAVKDTTERRGHRRFKVNAQAFAVFRPEFRKVGRIGDISQGGLSFEYIDTAGAGKEAADSTETLPSLELDIFVKDNSFYVSRLPIVVVQENSLDNVSDTQGQDPVSKSCHVQFQDLSSRQKNQIDFFIENHVVR